MNTVPIEVDIPSGVNTGDHNSELNDNFESFTSLFFSNVVAETQSYMYPNQVADYWAMSPACIWTLIWPK